MIVEDRCQSTGTNVHTRSMAIEGSVRSPSSRTGIALVACLTFLAGGCGDPDAGPSAERVTTETTVATEWAAGTFVGRVEDSEAFIAVLASPEGLVAAYVCDGTPTSAATVAASFDGSVTGGDMFDLGVAEGEVTVAGTIAGETVTGTVTINGTEHDFTAALVAEPAGLYVAKAAVEGEEVVARWVLTADGQRGSLRQGTTRLAPPIIDPTVETVIDPTTDVNRALDPASTQLIARISDDVELVDPYIDPTTDI